MASKPPETSARPDQEVTTSDQRALDRAWDGFEPEERLIVGFVSLNEGIDATTAAGRLQMGVLAAIAEFERARIAERVRAGLQRARRKAIASGDHGTGPATIDVPGGSVRAAASVWGVSKSTAARWIRAGHQPERSGGIVRVQVVDSSGSIAT